MNYIIGVIMGLLSGWLWFSPSKAKVSELAERAYFEGQKDFYEKDIRIGLRPDSVYYWTKSPWNEGVAPVWNPLVKFGHEVNYK